MHFYPNISLCSEHSTCTLQLSDLWQCPLTIVLPRKQEAKIAACVTANLQTIAIRVPTHAIALKLIEESNCLIAAPNANKSDFLSPTSSDHVF